jgi:hypothetical protein
MQKYFSSHVTFSNLHKSGNTRRFTTQNINMNQIKQSGSRETVVLCFIFCVIKHVKSEELQPRNPHFP